METSSNFNFPVSLRPVFTAEGIEVPRVKAVVREDTKQPIANVSNRFKLITHAEVMEKAENFVRILGEPEVKYYPSSNGSILTAEYTYKELSEQVAKGDFVGLRVYIQNAYNATRSLIFRVGALRLVCLNGMIAPKDVFSITARHTIDMKDIEFPNPQQVLMGFQKMVKSCGELANIELSDDEVKTYAIRAVEENIVSEKALSAPREDNTAWGLYNQFTYHINHNESNKATQLGKLNRLDRVSRWFGETFH